MSHPTGVIVHHLPDLGLERKGKKGRKYEIVVAIKMLTKNLKT
jgi:hypothetical protein